MWLSGASTGRGLQRDADPWRTSLEHTPQPSAKPQSCWDLGSLGPAQRTEHAKCLSFQATLGPSLVDTTEQVLI